MVVFFWISYFSTIKGDDNNLMLLYTTDSVDGQVGNKDIQSNDYIPNE